MSQSFYGGVAGRPFVLKGTYPTIQDMVADFKKNDDNSKVDFGEYAIIESINKNNPENGRIFRRALDQTETKPIEYWELATNEDGTVQNFFVKKDTLYYNGAVYVGQIAGPSGDAPHFASLPTKIQAKNEDGSLAFDEDGAPIYLTHEIKHGNEDPELFDYDDIIAYYQENGKDPITGKGPVIDYNPVTGEEIRCAVYDLHSGTGAFSVNNAHLVPGKSEKGFNDDITWKWCSIRDEVGQSSVAYVGFTFPYMVVDFTANSVSPYYNAGEVQYNEYDRPYYTHSNLSTRKDTAEHPFYEEWNFSIPKGIHGMDVKNVRRIDSREIKEDKPVVILKLKDGLPFYSQETNKLEYSIYGENGHSDNNHMRQIWVCDLIDYNISEKGDLYTIYLGDYNTITKVHMNTAENDPESGKIIIDYSHNDEEELGQLTWVESIHIAEDGNVVVQSNNGTKLLSDKQKTLTWPTTMRISESGEVIVDYTTEDGVVINKETPLGWITEATLEIVDTDKDGNPDDYYLNIKYNNADRFTNVENLSLKTVNDIYFDKGAIYSKYNIKTENGDYVVKHIGTVDESYKNIVAGQTEEEVNAGSLRNGGIWLVTDKPMLQTAAGNGVE